jgi:hypothetical protein
MLPQGTLVLNVKVDGGTTVSLPYVTFSFIIVIT